MNRGNSTSAAYARLHQLQPTQADAHYLKRPVINSGLLNLRIDRQRLDGRVRGGRRRALARHLRRHPTPAERVLWALLRRHRLGTKFKRKAIVRDRIVDFYAPSL